MSVMPWSIEWSDIEQLIDDGSSPAVFATLAAIPEEDRQAFGKHALAAVKACWERELSPDRGSLEAAQTANLMCGTVDNVLSRSAWTLDGIDHTVEVVAHRPAEWRNRFSARLVANHAPWWRVVRALERRGLATLPHDDDYLVGMVAGFSRAHAPVVEQLTADPELIELAWRLFEVEGGGEFSLAAFDKYQGTGSRGWSAAFRALAADGRLDRDRLLDASLAALGRDFAQFRAHWFSAFHEALEPTVDERLARQTTYGALLSLDPPIRCVV
jgi:hypothetical protein